MALSRVKTWISGEVLTASDLNAEFNNIINNAVSLISPVSGSFDFDGNTIILDAAGATQVVSSTSKSWDFTCGAKSGTPATGAGSIMSFSSQTFTDNNTAVSGTATAHTFINIAAPTLAASNATVTTTDAATVRIAGAPADGTNQTITNKWALWVDAGNVRFDGDLQVRGLTDGRVPLIGASGLLSDSSIFTYTNTASIRDLRINGSGSSNVSLDIQNTHASGVASIDIKTEGTGDAHINFRVNALANTWTMGCDNSASDRFAISVGGTLGTSDAVRIDTSGAVNLLSSLQVDGTTYIGDTSNAGSTLGLTINQGAADDEILSLKSSDVAHGVTTLTETDTYAAFKKNAGANGGLSVIALADAGALPFNLQAVGVTSLTTKATGSGGAMVFDAAIASGTGTASIGANGNVAVFRDNGTTRFILDADGDSHQDVGTAWTNFDHLDDVATLDALAYNVARSNDPIKRKFGDWMMEKRDVLEQQKLVTFNKNGRHFVNMSKLSMLHTGAIRQVGEMLAQARQEIAELKEAVRLLTNKE